MPPQTATMISRSWRGDALSSSGMAAWGLALGIGGVQAAGFVVDLDLVLEDLLDDDFEVGHVVVPFDERPAAVHELEHAFLDQGGQFESAADFVHDFVAF